MITFHDSIDSRCRDPKRATAARLVSGPVVRYIVIGTDYGVLHTASGAIKAYRSASAAYRRAKAYREWHDSFYLRELHKMGSAATD